MKNDRCAVSAVTLCYIIAASVSYSASQPSLYHPALLARADMGRSATEKLCVILLLAAAFAFRQTSSCNGFDIPNFKRMMETKAAFGMLIRQCRKHLDTMAKQFNPKEFSKALAIACLSYNSCRDSIIEKTTRQLFLCLFNHATNKASLFYTHLNVTEDFRKAVVDGMICVARTDIADSPITAIDDLVTYARWVALSFG